MAFLGINIGANKDSTGQREIDDYIECFQKVSALQIILQLIFPHQILLGLRSFIPKKIFYHYLKPISHSRKKNNLLIQY